MSIGGQSDARSDRKVYRLTPEGFAKMKMLKTIKQKLRARFLNLSACWL